MPLHKAWRWPTDYRPQTFRSMPSCSASQSPRWPPPRVLYVADGVQSDNSQNLLGRLALSPHVTPLVGANEEYRDLGRDGIVVYFRTRKLRAEGGSGEDILAEAFALYSPFFLLTMIALNAFVG